ncbi:hypothetical protein CDL15_Pgr013512 [Punica granatum]|uniref:TIR domain-containing protein n=1 Tax=Punica granatum TaxID=22663 RepID=A0A218W0M2_PUNGR|nr:hypothetical protein CDL15_Pgr013512 [Punica granatum]
MEGKSSSDPIWDHATFVVDKEQSHKTKKRRSTPFIRGSNEVLLSYANHKSSKDLTLYLGRTLAKAGIRTINYGHDGHTASVEEIHRSSIYIPVICEDYLSTPGCLTELGYLFDIWKREPDKVILPIFHGLKPSDAFKRASTIIDKSRLDPFIREAGIEPLNVVAKMSPWVVTDPCSAEIVHLIAREVASIIHPKFPQEGPYFVGIDRKVEQIMNLLNAEVNDKRVVGMHGMGGIGKTTLAKVIYNRLSACFEGCCFLPDIRQTTKRMKNFCQNLQTKLISGILKRECDEITSADEGVSYMREVFCNMKVLIVLDDVDIRFNLTELIGDLDTFGPGSRIIVTSRYEKDLPRVDQTFEVPELCRWEIQLLFSCYTDANFHPFNVLAAEIVSLVGGLPLVVEVIGSLLFRREVAVWTETLQKLKLIPNKGVQEKLMISYEALDALQRQMFLDIACLVNGADRRIASYMWPEFSTSHFFEGSEYWHLSSLVKIRGDNELWMHDELRELGRQRLACQCGDTDFPMEIKPQTTRRDHGLFEGVKMEIKPETTWKDYGMFEGVKGKGKVGALIPQCDDLAPYEDMNTQGMTGGRFLNVEDASINRYDAFPDLRWLQLHRCPQNCEEAISFPKSLVILDVSWSNIAESWEGWGQIKMVKTLRVLNLTGCNHLITTPNFSGFPDLEVLILEQCCHLVKIDPSIRHLQNLVSLNLNFCTELSTLPKELGFMKALKELLIDGTSVQEISASIGHIETLQTVSASGCLSLDRLPSSIGYLRSLLVLSLDHARITEIPSSIKELVNLQKLSLRNCRSLGELPITFGELGFPLCELDVTKTGISKLPDSIGNLSSLRVLKLESCFIEEFPSTIVRLQRLEEIHASYCRSLTKFIPSDSYNVAFGRLMSLKTLRLGFSRISELPENFRSLPCLETLDLLQCNMLRKLPLLPSSITPLRYTCKGMKEPMLSWLDNLKEVLLADTDPEELICRETGSKEPTFRQRKFSLNGAPKLRIINFRLSWVNEISFPSFSWALHSLKKVVLSCVNLKYVSAFPPTLVSLTFQHCRSLKNVYLGRLKALKELYLDHSAMYQIGDLHEQEALEILKLSHCRVEHLGGLQKLTSLRSLTVSHCDHLSKLPDLSKLKALVELNLDKSAISQISGLSNLQALEILKVSDCGALEHLEGLQELTSLRSLTVSHCDRLSKLPDLSNLKTLRVLDIPGGWDD